ncbi:uncharacterized protein [Eurosta solidaginis]|uniref:uncharacterized protein isoform X2 n=1 Tax=Eurosta solidaginis TaxID=178769 RepID=UPI0035315F61
MQWPYFLELASIEYDFASYKPSGTAAASLFLALHLLKDNSNYQLVLAPTTGHQPCNAQYIHCTLARDGRRNRCIPTVGRQYQHWRFISCICNPSGQYDGLHYNGALAWSMCGYVESSFERVTIHYVLVTLILLESYRGFLLFTYNDGIFAELHKSKYCC